MKVGKGGVRGSEELNESEMSKKTREEKRGVGKNRTNNGVKNIPERRLGEEG